MQSFEFNKITKEYVNCKHSFLLQKNKNLTTGIFLTLCENEEMIEGSFHHDCNKFILRRITASGNPVLDYTLPDGWEKVDGEHYLIHTETGQKFGLSIIDTDTLKSMHM